MAKKAKAVPALSESATNYVAKLKSAGTDRDAVARVVTAMKADKALKATDVKAVANTYAVAGVKASSKATAFARISTRSLEVLRTAGNVAIASKARPWAMAIAALGGAAALMSTPGKSGSAMADDGKAKSDGATAKVASAKNDGSSIGQMVVGGAMMGTGLHVAKNLATFTRDGLSRGALARNAIRAAGGLMFVAGAGIGLPTPKAKADDGKDRSNGAAKAAPHMPTVMAGHPNQDAAAFYNSATLMSEVSSPEAARLADRTQSMFGPAINALGRSMVTRASPTKATPAPSGHQASSQDLSVLANGALGIGLGTLLGAPGKAKLIGLGLMAIGGKAATMVGDAKAREEGSGAYLNSSAKAKAQAAPETPSGAPRASGQQQQPAQQSSYVTVRGQTVQGTDAEIKAWQGRRSR